MAQSKGIRLISEDNFGDQGVLDQDASDSAWLTHPSTFSSVPVSISPPESLPIDWIAACRRLREMPQDYHPSPPYFNISNLDISWSGCAVDDGWAMCQDLDEYFNAGNGSCYTEDALMVLANAMPPKYAYPIYGLIFPILVFLAVIANVFVLLVLSKRHMQSPTNTVLLYMAVADLTVGIVPLPFTFYWFTLKNYTTPWRMTASWCYAYHYLMDALPPICHNVAIWLTVLLAAQRYIYIELPVRAQSICTIENVKRASVVIVAVSILCGSMKFGDSSYKAYRGFVAVDTEELEPYVDFVVGSCLCHSSKLVNSVGYDGYYETYFWIRAVVFVWLPSVLLICLNALLIRAIHSAQRRRDRLLSESRNREANRQKESNTTTMMLVIIVTIFLLVNCPQGFHIALLTIDTKLQLDMAFLRSDSDDRGLFLMIDNMLIIATYPLNFTIYCSMSTQFRETFKHLFCPSAISQSSLSRRGSSYYGYTPVASRTVSCTLRNGTVPDSSTSLVNNPKSRKKKPKVMTSRSVGWCDTEDNSEAPKMSIEKEPISDTCI